MMGGWALAAPATVGAFAVGEPVDPAGAGDALDPHPATKIASMVAARTRLPETG
jgi:hypothetical protein